MEVLKFRYVGKTSVTSFPGERCAVIVGVDGSAIFPAVELGRKTRFVPIIANKEISKIIVAGRFLNSSPPRLRCRCWFLLIGTYINVLLLFCDIFGDKCLILLKRFSRLRKGERTPPMTLLTHT